MARIKLPKAQRGGMATSFKPAKIAVSVTVANGLEAWVGVAGKDGKPGVMLGAPSKRSLVALWKKTHFSIPDPRMFHKVIIVPAQKRYRPR